MRWCFLQRTISNTGEKFQPLENVIREKLIPAIVGRKVSDVERRMLALPIRHGGLGIQNPTKTAQIEYETSTYVTRNLTALIQNQEQNLDNYNLDMVKAEIAKLHAEKERRLVNEFESVKALVSENLQRSLDQATEKGSGAWLAALPIQSLGYVLNKNEFRDGIALRYGWKIQHPQMHSCSD